MVVLKLPIKGAFDASAGGSFASVVSIRPCYTEKNRYVFETIAVATVSFPLGNEEE